MPEKTWVVSVDVEERDMLIAIQALYLKVFKQDITHRAIVSRAIHKLYTELTPAKG